MTGAGPGSVPSAATLRSWLGTVAEIARAANTSLPLPELLDLIADSVCRLTGQDFCAVLLPDHSGAQLTIEGSSGLSADYVEAVNATRPIRLRPGPQGEGPSSRAFRSQRPVQVADTATDTSFGPWEAASFGEGYRSVLSVPLIASGQPVGVLNSYRHQPHEFDAEDIVLLETLANQAAIAIEAATLRDEQRRTISRLEDAKTSLERQQAVLQRLDETHRELMNVVLDDSRLDAVIETLARRLDVAVAVEDRGGQLLAAADQGQGPALPPREAREDAEVSAALDTLATERTVVEVATRIGTRLVAPVVLAGDFVARVWATAAADGVPGLDAPTLERAAVIVAFQLLKQRSADEAEARLSRDLIGDLLSLDERTDQNALRARAANLAHDLSQPHGLLVVRPDAEATESPAGHARAARHSELFQRRVLSFVHAMAHRSKPRAVVSARHGDVVVLWPLTPGYATTHDLAESIRRAAPDQLSGATVSVAVGGRCEQLTDYQAVFRVARGALYLTNQGGARNRLVSVADLGVYQFLLQLREPKELGAFAERLLGPVQRYDRTRRTELLTTLRTYFANSCAVADTAKQLYVHPNTVSYRLRRVQELLDLDLRRADDLVNLQFALMVLDVFPPAEHHAQPDGHRDT